MLSSVAYATEAVLKVLTLGGLAFLYLTPWIALGVVVLLSVVVISYCQVVRAYPAAGRREPTRSSPTTRAAPPGWWSRRRLWSMTS